MDGTNVALMLLAILPLVGFAVFYAYLRQGSDRRGIRWQNRYDSVQHRNNQRVVDQAGETAAAEAESGPFGRGDDYGQGWQDYGTGR